MSELLGRLRAAFIADAPRSAMASQVGEETLPAAVPHVGLLCDVAAASVAGTGLALRLLSAARAPAGVVCHWQKTPRTLSTGGPPARPAARHLAARLSGRDLSARAIGRLVFTSLPGEPAGALADASRALAAASAAGAPAVVVIAGPRPAALDPLLAERDAIVIVTPPGAGALAEAASAGAGELGPPVLACEYRARAAERMLALAGIAAVGGLGRALEPARRAVA